MTRYLGTATPVEERELSDGISVTYDPEEGPMCMRGDPFRVSYRDEPASEDLLLFLQGGGVCWSEFCFAITGAPATIPETDLLRPGDEHNPFDGWDIVYVPYCDGSLFAGDADVDEDGDGAPDRFHRGLQNLSAALTLARERFSAPRRVVLAGSSGGGFGTILAAFLVRYVFPDAPLYVVNDAGVGVAREGDPRYVNALIDEFGVRDVLPDDCPECLEGGHIVGYVEYLLDRDPDVRVAAISSWYDYVISAIFLMLGQAEFADALRRRTDPVAAAHPDRYRRFFYAGAAHTATLGDVSGILGGDLSAVELPPGILEDIGRISFESTDTATVGDVRLDAWLRAMLDDDLERWPDSLSDPGEPPSPE